MKIKQSSKLRTCILRATLVAGLGFVTHAVGQQERAYLIDLNSRTATEIRSFGAQFNFTGATALNDAGQVAGYFNTPIPDGRRLGDSQHAFITGANGVGMIDLGTLGGFDSYALGINGSGQVVGYRETDLNHAFMTGPNGMGKTDLAVGGFASIATDINASAQVVGSFKTLLDHSHAFVTGPNGIGMVDLGTLWGGRGQSEAAAINDVGQVVGHSDTIGFGVYHAFITGRNGVGMADLGILGGRNSFASDINNTGQVVGTSDTIAANGDLSGPSHAFITGPNGGAMTDLGTLLRGNDSGATGINASGQVVGWSDTAPGVVGPNELYTGNPHAFITGPNGVGMTDLNSLVDLPKGVTLTHAVDINNVGQVIATATVSIIPEPEIYTMLLVGVGFMGFMARRKKRRGLCWGSEPGCSRHDVFWRTVAPRSCR